VSIQQIFLKSSGHIENWTIYSVYGFAEECNLRANKDVFDRFQVSQLTFFYSIWVYNIIFFQPSFDLLPVAALVGSKVILSNVLQCRVTVFEEFSTLDILHSRWHFATFVKFESNP